MRVDFEFRNFTFHYRLTLEDDDRPEARRLFIGINEESIRLVGNEYQVVVPAVLRSIHPDLHAAAIIRTLCPFLGPRLTLTFGVITKFSELLERDGLELTAVNASLPPWSVPTHSIPALLFSGGRDSVAASPILPTETRLLFIDRLTHFDETSAPDSMIEMTEPREMYRALRAIGRGVYMIHEDHTYIETMTEEEVARLHGMSLPPLDVLPQMMRSA